MVYLILYARKQRLYGHLKLLIIAVCCRDSPLTMPLREAVHAWTKCEENTLLRWLEGHPEHDNMKRRNLAEAIKKEAFIDVPISAMSILNKLHNMFNNWKQTKADSEQSGFGARPGEGEMTIREALNKRCRWFDRLDAIFSPYERKRPIGSFKQSQSQSVAQPDLQGDSLSGLPTIARVEEPPAIPEEAEEEEGEGGGGENDDMQLPDLPTTVPATPMPVRRAALMQAPPTAENQRKRRRTDRTTGAQEELDEMHALAERRIEESNVEAIEIACIQAEEETKRFEKTSALVDRLVESQVALMCTQQEQQGKPFELLNKVIERRV
ncbi:hypothetical protein KEM55_004807 [Ascosphaera atra]|nr:hypothetical protein KEM55_004807 [Ascosphaera atra]